MSVRNVLKLIQTLENKNIHDYNFNMLGALNWKYKLFNVHMIINVFAAGGLLSALLFSREGFCPPSHFYGRAFVRPVIFTGGLLSALSFSREGFCPPCQFWTGRLLSGRAFVLHSNLTPALFSILYLTGQQFSIILLCLTGQQFLIHSISSANSSAV
jgi:hypothetical protein